MIILILFVTIAIILIAILALSEPPADRCIHCDIPTDPAPCGAMLCEYCCGRCGELKTRRCRWMKQKESEMEGQVWD
jgi:hypothetical protein